MSTFFWIGFAIGSLYSLGLIAATVYDARGSFSGPPMAIGIRDAVDTAMKAVLAPFMGGGVVALIGAVIGAMT